MGMSKTVGPRKKSCRDMVIGEELQLQALHLWL